MTSGTARQSGSSPETEGGDEPGLIQQADDCAAPGIEADLADVIAADPYHPGPANAYLRQHGIAVWAVVGGYKAVGDIERVAEDFELPATAVEQALEYYRRHQADIDAYLAMLAA